MPLPHAPQRASHVAFELRRLERHRAAVLAQHPGGELGDGGVLGDEDAVLELSRLAVGAPHPPGRVAEHLDPRRADRVADLPRRPAAVQLDVEVCRRAEVALPPRRELDVAADARDAEGADVLAVEVVADDVPEPVVVEERIGIERPLALLVAGDRPVVEAHRPLLRDGVLELRQPSRRLRRIVGIEHLHAARGLGRRLGEPRPPEREVLEREPQRLGVRELSLEQVKRGLQRRELVVVELELRQEVLLGPQRV